MAIFSSRPGMSPWRELRDIRERMDRIISSAIGGARPREERMEWSPAVDIEERKDELVLMAELPGMTREDIDVELENNVLTIRGEKKEERKVEEARGRHVEVERGEGRGQGGGDVEQA